MSFDLTNPGLQYDAPIDPATGLPIAAPRQVFFKNPMARNVQVVQDVHNALPAAGIETQPSSVASVSDNGVTTNGEVLPPDVKFSGGEPMLDAPTLPKMFKPSFQQATTDSAGLPARINPGETKLGKLAHILAAATRGALAGSGGGNFGEGVQLAEQQPVRQAIQRQQVEAGGLQNQAARANIGLLPFQRAQALATLQHTNVETQGALDKLNDHSDEDLRRAQAAAIPSETALRQAQTEAAFYKDDPNVGLVDVRTGKAISNADTIPLTAEEAVVLGKQEGDRVPLKLKNTASEIAARGFTNYSTEEGVFEKNRITGKTVRLGSNPRMVFAPENKIVPAAVDPNNPGALTYVRAGDALNNPNIQAPQSAPVQTAKATAKAVAPGGTVGEELNAYNTAIAHADLLEQAAKALGNKDWPTSWNRLRNKFKTEFGIDTVPTYQTIANAYSREVTKALTGGHITDSEIATNGATLPANASPAQIAGVIGAYRSLMSSKKKTRAKGIEEGMKGKANLADPEPVQDEPAKPTEYVPPGAIPIN